MERNLFLELFFSKIKLHSTTQTLTIYVHSQLYEHTYTNPISISIFED